MGPAPAPRKETGKLGPAHGNASPSIRPLQCHQLARQFEIPGFSSLANGVCF